MEEKNLVPLKNDVDESGVLVERNRKRQAEKTKRIFIRTVVVLLLIGLIYGAIKLFPMAKEFFNSWGDPSKNNSPITNGESDSNSSDSNSQNGISTDDGSGNGQNSANPSTPPDKDTESNDKNNKNPEDTDKDSNAENGNSSSTDTNTSQDVESTVKHKITGFGKTKYSAVNESGCEIDFSSKFKKISPSEISKKYGSDSPLVLITHSQGNEAYSNGISYSESDAFYSESSNVNSLGKIISDMLNAYGIPTIQLSEVYAGGGVFGSQKEYEKSLAETLKKYPSISYVFNISRGIKINDDLTMNKSYVERNGQKLAQIKLISGTNWDIATKDQIENVRFAFDLGKFLNIETDCFVKQNVISRFALSQNIVPLCTNIEIGEYANSYDEAKRSAELFATLLYMYLSS